MPDLHLAHTHTYTSSQVMPFSTACSTPLSNFEAGLNYKDVSDPAVMVAFPVK
jgi:isoleucyl-tRNA synthetase